MELEIGKGDARKEEIRRGAKSLKNGKAAESDKIIMSRDDNVWRRRNVGTTDKTLQEGVETGKSAKGMEGWHYYTSAKEWRCKGIIKLERHHLTLIPGQDYGHSNTKPHERGHRRETAPGTSGV